MNLPFNKVRCEKSLIQQAKPVLGVCGLLDLLNVEFVQINACEK